MRLLRVKPILFLAVVSFSALVGCASDSDNGYYRTVASPEFAAQGENIPPTIQKLPASNQARQPELANPQKPQKPKSKSAQTLTPEGTRLQPTQGSN